MKNILLPTDFSENSWNAIKYAISLFKTKPCNFYLLHVTLISYNTGSSEYPLIPSDGVIEKTLLSQAKTALKNLLKDCEEYASNSKHHFFSLSSYDFFIDSVKNHIQEKKIDLIVMGTKGASGLNEVIIGSNTGDLITQVQCPTLIVPEDTSFKPLKEIAFPTDYNIFYQTSILKEILEFVKMHNAFLRIVHIVKRDETLTPYQIENKEMLSTFFTDENCTFHKITSKKIEAGVQCFVESRDIDMIVMIAKNLNLFQRILFRPTVEEISYHTEIPFLVLHEEIK
jgi:nucleotide-binding universal stress UspA family protein